MSWTAWQLLADRNHWYADTLDYEGASCYELGTGGPRGGNVRPHYVGETENEKARRQQYAPHGSHLSKLIDRHLRDGCCFFYRGWAVGSKREAVAMQNRLSKQYGYDWNILLNALDDSD